MTGWKLRVYHSSPSLVRNLLASMRGYQLRRWRYGADTEDLVAQAIEREHWSSERWQSYQQERLGYVLHRAVTKVPYYREHWSERRRKGDSSSWEYLDNWSVLEKEPLRANPTAFVADDCNIRKMFHEHTSGTTGKPLDLWWSRDTVKSYYALFEARLRHWHGVSRYSRWAIMGGQLITPVEQISPPFWVWNHPMKQLYLSSYHLTSKFMPSYLEAIDQYKIEYIYAYTSSVYVLAREIMRSGYRLNSRLKVIFTNAEPLYQHQREVISEAFNCPVRETYGMSEIVSAAGECEHGDMHLWPEVGITEIIAEGMATNPDQVGMVIGTGILNADMPLIRYQVGDRAKLHNDQQVCKCGRHLPRLGEIEGRQDDILYSADGRQIGRLDPVFKSSLPIREAQIIQDTLSHFRIVLVPADGYTERDGHSIAERLRERVGKATITVHEVSVIPRTSNGKFRSVICNIPREERSRLK